MDLIDTLRKKIEVLDDGEYVPGLKAVLVHIETAFRHLLRGQETDDETAFTDAIYRTNQAFEGSIKEAYRVLADQDPAKKRPFDIENYLEQNNVFRSRVLNQLTTYRTEWRNPSAHDHKLEFDESESFLAIVSVSAFSCLLLDQIAERLSFKKSQAEAEANKEALSINLTEPERVGLLDRVTNLLQQFCAMGLPSSLSSAKQTEIQIIGALHGFMASIAPELSIQTEVKLDVEQHFRADLLISHGNEKLIIEVKRHIRTDRLINAVAQVEKYLLVGGIKKAILLALPELPEEMEKFSSHVNVPDAQLVVLAPKGSNLSLQRTPPSQRRAG
jgi:hypothetical protein